ncbi:histidine kinase [Anaerosporomusa subterranea]|uniref:histidine kinase n=1 Tax=Anaerosporomusa subterranea TaxID=1794912 RepID=A0A154BPZ4_ANASB|nr:sensor histidine kinase KdpD [Anaerosporomusa subterranea]KYZ76027.1 histidine kinase [Anaerosporomusa subterranea]
MQNNKRQKQRPDPDALLEKINRSSKGKLTVFLGAAAGVGKTFTMLESAHERRREGVDIVIGWVETHGRQETENLVAGLEIILAKTLQYRNKELQEMDIDAIIARDPELVLIDELAHTNVSGSRHVRRFQDVDELLKAGINVYTTLNIQHVESLNDVVAQITGIVVKETVPDYIIEQADSVQLIDIPPEDLIKRLKEGKVYVPGQAEQALQRFFRPGNINALRELSLRFTASRVDKDLNEYMRDHNINKPWPAAGRVMVCVSASPFSTQLIRAARRLSAGLQAEWLAVHIETARRFAAGDAERDRIVRNMRLAEELGAKTLSASASDLASEILELAHVHNVTSIVVGKPRHGRLWELFHGSVVDKLIRRSGGVNIYVIQANEEQVQVSNIATEPAGKRAIWLPYGGSFLMVAVVTLFSWALRGGIENSNISLLYQLPVVFSAFWWGRWPSYFTGICSVLAFDFLFIPPIFTFSVDDIRYLWSFLTFLIVAFVIGGRTELLRYEAVTARLREKNTHALFDFSREIAAAIDLDSIVRELGSQIADALNRGIVVLLPDENEKLVVWAQHEPGVESRQESGDYKNTSLIDNDETAVATWVYQHKQVAGRSTDTLPGAQYLYFPLQTRDNVVGVLGICIIEKLITPEQRRLMDAWAGLAAIAIERVKLTRKAREAALLLESDRLHTALFNSISHELRTPMSSIIGSATTLLESEAMYSAEERRELIENIKVSSTRMNLTLINLLDTARLESGMMRLKVDWCDIEDIIGSALRNLTEQIKDRALDIIIPDDTPLLRGDCVLLGQVIINLVDNAAKYSPQGSSIEIRGSRDKNSLQVSVGDRGIGIPEADLPRIFEKFYRIQFGENTIPGTGLGLSICKSIIEAHDGKIWAENRSGGGAKISFSVPLTGNKNDFALTEGERAYD